MTSNTSAPGNNQQPPSPPGANAPAIEPARAAAYDPATSAKDNQFKCPSCKAFGCPAYSSTLSEAGRRRYRRCAKCQFKFRTLQPRIPGGFGSEYVDA